MAGLGMAGMLAYWALIIRFVDALDWVGLTIAGVCMAVLLVALLGYGGQQALAAFGGV